MKYISNNFSTTIVKDLYVQFKERSILCDLILKCVSDDFISNDVIRDNDLGKHIHDTDACTLGNNNKHSASTLNCKTHHDDVTLPDNIQTGITTSLSLTTDLVTNSSESHESHIDTFSHDIKSINHNDKPELFRVHSCVLASHSSYFRTMLLSDYKRKSKEANVYEIYNCNDKILTQIIDFLYTGEIDISMENLACILSCADFLGIDSIILMCIEFMSSTLCLCSVVFYSTLCYRYNITTVLQRIFALISLRMHYFLSSQSVMKAKYTFIRYILQAKELNYVEESLLLQTVKDWLEFDSVRSKYQVDLFQCIDVSYLSDKLILDNSMFFSTVSVNMNVISSSDSLLVRTHKSHRNDYVRLLLYEYSADCWHVLKQPLVCEILNGCEDIIQYKMIVYVIITEPKDSYGYSDNDQESKIFLKFDLHNNEWDELSSPPLSIGGKCRLILHEEKIVCIDQGGRVAEYCIHKNTWLFISAHQQYLPHVTIYSVPFIVNNTLFILRSHFSADGMGLSGQYFTLFELNILSGVWKILIKDSDYSDLGLIEEVDRLSSYSYKLDGIMYYDTWGRQRALFCFTSRIWNPVQQNNTIQNHPSWIETAYGHTTRKSRTYVIARMNEVHPKLEADGFTENASVSTVCLDDRLSCTQCSQDNNLNTIKSLLVSYDCSTNRYKRMEMPPYNISAVIVNATISTDRLNSY